MAKQTFTSGQVLTAAQMNSLQANDYNLTVTTQTDNYTLVAADKGTREVANKATAITFTVPSATFAAGDIVEIHNIGAGTLTLAGSGVTINSADVLTVAQWQGGTLYFTSASAAIWFPRAKTVSSGLVLISSTTIGSAVSSVTVSSAFSSTYDNYRIIIGGGVSSVDGTYLLLQLGSTTTGYYTGGLSQSYAGTSSSSSQANAASARVGLGHTSQLFLIMDIVSPNLAKVTQFASMPVADPTTNQQVYWLGGYVNSTTQFTAFTISPATGTITGGTIRVYGYQNS